MILAAALVMAVVASAGSAHYPQKFRTFFDVEDPHVPSSLTAGASAPTADVSAVAAASDGAVWIGNGRGVLRFDSKANTRDRWQYFAGRRYLPDDHVRALLPDSAGGMWVRTDTGVTHIELRPMSLAEKAARFEERVSARHDRYGMVAPSDLREPGELATSTTRSDDNDGLWTAMYGAAECFRYAATKSPEALARAKRATEAVLFLEQITGRPGFPARSYVRREEARPADGQWHWTEDGRFQWKGDTSSDEMVGHFFLYSIVYDLLPDPVLRTRVAAAARRIMDHILENGLSLVDVTGKPTRWGRWSPDYFSTPEGRPDSPLNAIELLSFLKATYHLTGAARYDAEYRRAATKLGYAAIAQRYAELREEINYSDEELAMLAFYPLLRYEKERDLVMQYRRALEQWWQNMRREENPLWTFLYLECSPGSKPDTEAAVRTLYRIPMDLVSWTVVNSHRQDVQWDEAKDRFQKRQAVTLVAPDERPVMKWNGNPFVVDGGNGGQSEEDGTFFLLPYWFGRYRGYISLP